MFLEIVERCDMLFVLILIVIFRNLKTGWMMNQSMFLILMVSNLMTGMKKKMASGKHHKLVS